MAKTYSFLNFNCSIEGPGGLITLGSGSGAGKEGITFAPNDDINNMEIGTDGSGQHSLNGNRSGTVSVQLLKTSTTNGLLMAMFNFQRQNPRFHGQNTISGIDSISGDTHLCQQVAFKRKPDMKQGDVAGMNVWTFDAVMMDSSLAIS